MEKSWRSNLEILYPIASHTSPVASGIGAWGISSGLPPLASGLGHGISPPGRQETTVRTGHGTTDWFQIGKGVLQGCILSPCLFNLYAEYIMRNAGLEEAQAGIKIAGRNINNLRYADDTTLMHRGSGDTGSETSTSRRRSDG